MTDQSREFWIFRNEKNPQLDVVLIQEPFGTHSSEYIHVIEKSAFDSVVKERDELRAENELLDLKLNAYISGVDQLNNIWLEHGCEKSSSTCLVCKAHNAVHDRIDKALRGADEK